jgi:hypothetical protein
LSSLELEGTGVKVWKYKGVEGKENTNTVYCIERETEGMVTKKNKKVERRKKWNEEEIYSFFDHSLNPQPFREKGRFLSNAIAFFI